MNTFVEGKLYLGFAHTVPMKIYGSNEKSAVSETKKEYFVFCLHPGFANEDIRGTLQVFDTYIPHQRRQTLVRCL